MASVARHRTPKGEEIDYLIHPIGGTIMLDCRMYKLRGSDCQATLALRLGETLDDAILRLVSLMTIGGSQCAGTRT